MLTSPFLQIYCDGWKTEGRLVLVPLDSGYLKVCCLSTLIFCVAEIAEKFHIGQLLTKSVQKKGPAPFTGSRPWKYD
jgi:hypothetical protein